MVPLAPVDDDVQLALLRHGQSEQVRFEFYENMDMNKSDFLEFFSVSDIPSF